MRCYNNWNRYFSFIYLFLIIFNIQGCNINTDYNNQDPVETLLFLHSKFCLSKPLSKDKFIEFLLDEGFVRKLNNYSKVKENLNIRSKIYVKINSSCVTSVQFKKNYAFGLLLFFKKVDRELSIFGFKHKEEKEISDFDDGELKQIKQSYPKDRYSYTVLDFSINKQGQYVFKLETSLEFTNANSSDEQQIYLWGGGGAMLFLLVFMAYFFIKKYLYGYSNNPNEDLLSLLPEQLQEAEKYLSKNNLLEKTLDKFGVSPDVFTTAIHVLTFLSAQKKAVWISKRINARGKFERNFNIFRYQDISLDDNFPLNLKKLRIYLPDRFTTPLDALIKAKEFPKSNRIITLIIGKGSEYQEHLYFITKQLDNKLVAPQGNEMTRLLLSPNAELVLAEILSRQLSLQQISPYRVSGGVSNQSVFFGRIEIINQIINRDPANYLVVGGRQMGKSSLLKALQYHYADNASVRCYYQSLSGEVLIPRLAAMLNLPVSVKPEDFACDLDTYLKTINKHLVFLIDEADRFIEHETDNDYQVLNVLRRLSEEGRCSFILAGFWQLYQHAALNYQSPIRNFAEIVSVGALEKEACYQLATEPMKSMNLSFSNNTIVETLVESCGQRANLIAIACQHIVLKIPVGQRIIEASDVYKALHCKGIQDALTGWVIGETEQEQHYDKLVIYATIGKDNFNVSKLVQLLQDKGMKVDISELDRSLARLVLAYTLGKNQDTSHYTYRVPLFVEMLLGDDPAMRLTMELDKFS